VDPSYFYKHSIISANHLSFVNRILFWIAIFNPCFGLVLHPFYRVFYY